MINDLRKIKKKREKEIVLLIVHGLCTLFHLILFLMDHKYTGMAQVHIDYLIYILQDSMRVVDVKPAATFIIYF